jgi:hypothetical protein
MLLTTMSIIKMIDFGVNRLHLMRGVSPKCFFLLFSQRSRFDHENDFGFELILIFRYVFWPWGAINEFINVLKVFFRCFEGLSARVGMKGLGYFL